MKSFVLPDPAIVALSDRVVFAAVDSDKEVNTGFMEKYAVNAWPTLYMLDIDGKVLGMWQGAASVEELRELINSSLDARSAAHDPKGPVAALTEAKRAHARRDYHGAARHYQAALDRGGADWPRRSEALHGLLFSAYRLGQWDRCTKLGIDHVATIEGAALPTDFGYLVLTCAERGKNPALARKAREETIARLRGHTERPPASSSVDDRADALNLLSDALRAQGDKDGARAALEKQIALLEKAAQTAPSPEAAGTFDYQRMNTYLALGRGEEAVKMLRQRAKEQPDNYEPRARLAQALLSLGRHIEAAAAMDDAIAKAYGPRKLGYYATRAKIAAALGDKAGEKKALQELIAHYEKLEATHKREKSNREKVDAARARLRKL
jgi:tetratricopeptide (TPR) repeat protein